MKVAFIGLGSNLGEREMHLRKALTALSKVPGVLILEESTIQETKPYGLTDQPDFLNQVVKIMTDLEPTDLLTELKKIETLLGRFETYKWGPRIIDLDILFMGETIYRDVNLIIPHPGVSQREFVLKPMTEIAPGFIDPVTGKTMKQLYADLLPIKVDESSMEMKEIADMRAVSTIILAAGKGTRMKSDKAKVTFRLAERSLLQRVIDTASKLESEIICVVVGYQKESVIESLEENDRISFAEQVEQNGTGHAVIVTEPVFENFDGDIFILCGDVPLLKSETLQNLLKEHRASNSACTVLTCIMDDPARYGRIIRNPETKHVDKIVEYKDATDEQREICEINTGIYCFDARTLFQTLKQVTNNNMQNEYYLTDTLEILNKQGAIVSAVLLDNFIEASGINSQEQLSELEVAYYDQIKSHWLNHGVVIENPCSVIIGENVKIGHDTTIEANCILKGETLIGSNCFIGCNSYLVDAVIDSNVVLKGYNVVNGTAIVEGDRLSLGEMVLADE